MESGVEQSAEKTNQSWVQNKLPLVESRQAEHLEAVDADDVVLGAVENDDDAVVGYDVTARQTRDLKPKNKRDRSHKQAFH